MANNKHLTLDDREVIESMLKDKSSLRRLEILLRKTQPLFQRKYVPVWYSVDLEEYTLITMLASSDLPVLKNIFARPATQNVSISFVKAALCVILSVWIFKCTYVPDWKSHRMFAMGVGSVLVVVLRNDFIKLKMHTRNIGVFYQKQDLVSPFLKKKYVILMGLSLRLLNKSNPPTIFM
ncbi:MAG TPA: hypothetical protein VN258_14005 [Mobilitalea sp.]|nr:hypothetical protein [Mobilitalea sp.]